MSRLRSQGLPPVVDRHTRFLILGSFPGNFSLRKKQYYAFPQNQFWPIVLRLLGRGGSQLNYQERIGLLLRHGIGLWDVIRCCERNGSPDAGLRRVELNDFEKFLRQWSNIRIVYLNGRAAQNYFEQAGITSVDAHYLPSTSPAYTIGLDRKILIWKKTICGEEFLTGSGGCWIPAKRF